MSRISCEKVLHMLLWIPNDAIFFFSDSFNKLMKTDKTDALGLSFLKKTVHVSRSSRRRISYKMLSNWLEKSSVIHPNTFGASFGFLCFIWVSHVLLWSEIVKLLNLGCPKAASLLHGDLIESFSASVHDRRFIQLQKRAQHKSENPKYETSWPKFQSR